MRRHLGFGGTGVLAMILCLSSPAAAQVVSLGAEVILASNQPGPGGAGADPRLGHLIGELRKVFGYSRYELLASPSGSSQINQAWQTDLPGDRILRITPTAVRGSSIQAQVQVVAAGGRPLMSSLVRMESGRTVLVGGPPYGGGVLIIAISAGVR